MHRTVSLFRRSNLQRWERRRVQLGRLRAPTFLTLSGCALHVKRIHARTERTRGFSGTLPPAQVAPPRPALAPRALIDPPHTDAQPLATRASALPLPGQHASRFPFRSTRGGPWRPPARRPVVLLHFRTLAGASAWARPTRRRAT
jgi:hypothetical protein